ncbi:MAG: YbjN domain-containing protein [Planctomycetes bacterium]|nr:YbjN domain-containing protein [Planctomycetota bacterium]
MERNRTGSPGIIEIQGCLHVGQFSAILFRTSDEREDFLLREFENMPVDVDLIGVAPGLYAENESTVAEGSGRDVDASAAKAASTDSVPARADSIIGGLCGLCAAVPDTAAWVKLVQHLFTDPDSAQGDALDEPVAWLRTAVDDAMGSSLEGGNTDPDPLLFRTLLAELAGRDPSDGWNASEVLESLLGSLPPALSAQSDVRDWARIVGDVLSNKREVAALSDEGSIVRRAIMLMLLRPEPKDILAAGRSSLRAGHQVSALAALLSGTWAGLERLPNNIKASGGEFSLLAQAKAALINRWLALDDTANLPLTEFLNPLLESSDAGPMGQKLVLKVGGQVLLRRDIEADVVLRSVRDAAELLGQKLAYDRDKDRLSLRFDFEGGRTQTIFIEKGMPDRRGHKTIRIWSPCMDLSTATQRKKLTKKMYEHLMRLNSAPNLNCRFAESMRDQAVIVLVDQLAETLDQKELKAHMENVAMAADMFERAEGVDVY